MNYGQRFMTLYRRQGSRPFPRKRNAKKAKWLSGEALQIAWKRREANIRWIMEKAREFQKNIYFCFIDYAKAFVWITINCGQFFKRWEYQTT